MDKLKKLIALGEEIGVPLAALLQLAISLREPIQIDEPEEIYSKGYTKTLCIKTTTSADLTEEGEMLAQEIHDIIDGVPTEGWKKSFEEWYKLFPLKIGEREIRRGKTRASKLFREATKKIPAAELVELLEKDINRKTYRETMWMPGPIKWLEDEHYLNITNVQSVSLHGKEIA